MSRYCSVVLFVLSLIVSAPPVSAQTRWELIAPVTGHTTVTLPTPSTAGTMRRLTDGDATGALVIGDGTNWTCAEAKSQEVAVVTCPPYNAKGDGVTDNLAAFTAANASGLGTIYFPPGTYMVGGAITLNDNHRYLGAGVGITIVKMMPAITNTLFGSVTPLANVELAHMTIDGNRLNNPQVSYALIGFGYAGSIQPVTNLRMHDLQVQNSTEYGIGLEGGAYSDIFLNDITIDSTDRDGIDLKLGANVLNENIFLNNIHISNFGLSGDGGQAGIDARGKVHLSNITVEDVQGTDTGIRFNRGTDPSQVLSSARSTLSGFTIYEKTGDFGGSVGIYIRHANITIANGYIFGTSLGVYMEGPASPAPTGSLFTNVTVEGARGTGYYSYGTADSHFSFMNCQAINGLDGFRVAGDFTRIIGSRISGNSGIGIKVHVMSDNSIIMGNHLSSNGTNFENGNTTTHVNSNVGIVTKNNGQATVLSGTTSIVVAHGLFSIPAISAIAVTLNNDTTNDIVKAWVSTVTVTTFTISVDADPGSSGAIFAWQASTLN